MGDYRRPLPARVKAAIVDLHEAHPSWSVRKLAAETGASRETVRRTVRAAEVSRRAAVAARVAGPGLPGVGASPGSDRAADSRTPAQALWDARALSEAEHDAWDADPSVGSGGPSWWGIW
jgi:hypothetical protein